MTQKLSIIENLKSIKGIEAKSGFKQIKPDEENDWVNQGDRAYYDFISIGNKKDKTNASIFKEYAIGLATNRDSWVYSSSKSQLIEQMKRFVNNYNDEVDAFKSISSLTNDKSKVDWSRSLKNRAERKQKLELNNSCLISSTYRPYQRQYLYFDRPLIEAAGRTPEFFPDKDKKNLVISITGIGAHSFSCLITDSIPCLDMVSKGQAFPLKTYEKASDAGELFQQATVEDEYVERDGISDEGYVNFQSAYSDKSFSKEDLFYYIYGLLHSEDYRERFQNNLSKELPRIPAVKKFEDFMAFSKAGRDLAELHLNYETVEPFPVDINGGSLDLSLSMGKQSPEEFYRVTKMKFGGKRPNQDKTTVIYNHNITMSNIPLEAYDYFVNGKPALGWVMDRQQVTKDKASGIVNDCNDYANETVGDPAYPLKLFQRVITVSLETMKIVRALPELNI